MDCRPGSKEVHRPDHAPSKRRAAPWGAAACPKALGSDRSAPARSAENMLGWEGPTSGPLTFRNGATLSRQRRLAQSNLSARARASADVDSDLKSRAPRRQVAGWSRLSRQKSE
jgi:hypothetical protein